MNIPDQVVNHQQSLKERADPITLRELVGIYLQRNDYNPKTIVHYEITVKLAERWLGKRCLARDFFCDEGLTRFMKYLANSPIKKGSRNKKRTPRTINNNRRLICIWWSWAFRQTQRNGRNWCHVMPPNKEDVPKRFENRKTPVAWTPSEVGEMILNSDAGPACRGWTTRHWRTLLLTAYETGWRIGTLRSLRWCHWKGDTLTFDLPAKHKTDTKIISEDLQAELKALAYQNVSQNIFPMPVGNFIWDGLKDILMACGLAQKGEDLRRHMWHKFRRTHATQIAKATTIDRAAAALCHSDRATTIRSYVDPTQLNNAYIPLPRPGGDA